MRALVLIGLGGGLGSLARYAIAGLWLPWTRAGFPWGTLLVNVAGSFVIGLVLGGAGERGWLTPELRLALATGFCGGFTTMSSFSFEALLLLEQGAVGLALGYAVLSVLASLTAVWSGVALIRLM